MFDNRYTEGDAWNYRFNAFQDPYGLIGLYGSNETFVEKLTEFMDRATWIYFDQYIVNNPYYN